MSAPQRFLIITASIGGGHVSAGRALLEALEVTGAEARLVDLLDYTTVPFRRLYRQAYFDLVRTAPDLVDWLGRRLDRAASEDKTVRQRLRARLTRLGSYHLPRIIDAYRPDAVVHTHFLPPEILSTRQRKLVYPQAVVVTDFAAHGLWMQPNVGRYFVAAEEVKVHLTESGVDPDRVRVTGIPIDRRFALLPSRAEARARAGLRQDRDLLLLIASGLAPRVLQLLLRQLRALRWPLSVLVVCGRTPELLSVARAESAEASGLVDFTVVGFSTEVPLLMAAADLLVGKPGGLTTSEALAAGLPFAVVDPYPLQEEANANFLLEHGAGMRIEPLTTFGHKLKNYFANDARRAAMRANARAHARPHAADAIAAELLAGVPRPRSAA